MVSLLPVFNAPIYAAGFQEAYAAKSFALDLSADPVKSLGITRVGDAFLWLGSTWEVVGMISLLCCGRRVICVREVNSGVVHWSLSGRECCQRPDIQTHFILHEEGKK